MQWKVKVLNERMPSIKKAEIGNISCALADSLSRTRNDNSSTKKTIFNWHRNKSFFKSNITFYVFTHFLHTALMLLHISQ